MSDGGFQDQRPYREDDIEVREERYLAQRELDPAFLLKEAQEGRMDEIQAYMAVHDIIAQAEPALKALKELAMPKLLQRGKDEYRSGARRVFIRAGRRIYDYSGYEGWRTAKEAITKVETAMKAGAQNGQGVISPDGEVIPAATFTHAADSIIIENI